MDCIFCKIAAGEISADILHRDADLVAFRDLRPQAPVHLLIIPTKHIETVLDLQPGDDAVMGRMLRLADDLARSQGLEEKGFRLVINCKAHGGQEVYHLHLHLLGGRPMHWPPG
ncbi:MAG: histidine triad nucleotide-binding protein [Candidatus Zixiibacteriota bacterium]|nr:MAG: histidine triad nucleotide-binding protein [candidate division Zixibacteria bacterium]